MSKNHHSGFLITIAKWIAGKLQLLFKVFKKLEDAIKYGIKSMCDNFKIYDQDGNLVHTEGSCYNGQYA